jgi:hypothetical protein
MNHPQTEVSSQNMSEVRVAEELLPSKMLSEQPSSGLHDFS